MDPATGKFKPVKKKNAQNEVDSLMAAKFYLDPATGELKPLGEKINPDWKLYDTIPRFNNHIIDIGFGFAFPLRDFHATDTANGSSGYVAQGYSLSTGLFLGFAEGSEAGWYLGASYSGFRKSSTFAESLNAALSIYQTGEEDEIEILRLDPNYRPRYDIYSLRTGFAFEGSDARVSVYGSLLADLNFTRINRFTLENTDLDRKKIRTPLASSSGFTAAFGLRFQQQLSLGIAFHYIGETSLLFNPSDRRDLPDGIFSGLSLQRRIHFLEVKMRYSFIKRGGWKPPKVQAAN
jgi:hypothetical protein